MTIKIVDKSNLSKGTQVTLFNNHGRSVSSNVITEIGQYEISFSDGAPIRLWGRESMIIVATDNPKVTKAKREYDLKSTVRYLNHFGGLDKAPEEVRVKLEEIRTLIDDDDFKRSINLLNAGGASSTEGESIFRFLDSQEDVVL
jgi:hypothetical protein